MDADASDAGVVACSALQDRVPEHCVVVSVEQARRCYERQTLGNGVAGPHDGWFVIVMGVFLLLLGVYRTVRG